MAPSYGIAKRQNPAICSQRDRFPVYDHPLTLKDEVVEFRNDGDAERNPTARHRSVSHERQGVLSAQSVKLFCEVPQLTIS